MRICFLAFAAAIFLSVMNLALAANAPELCTNGGFEQAQKNLPADWEPITVGAEAEYSIDRDVKHTGQQSGRITCPKTSRVYFRSKPIQVAPGEKITAGAWVKFKDVPVGQGTIILIGEFARDEKHQGEVQKFNILLRKGTEGDWKFVEGTQTVPTMMNVMWLRIGFSYSSGTVWFDDVSIKSDTSLVARLEIDGPRITPAMDAIPVGILNRAGRKGSVTARVEFDEQSSELKVNLNGQPQQEAMVPVKITKRGKATLVATLVEKSSPIFVEKRDVTIPPAIVLRPLLPTHWVLEDGVPKIDADVEVAVTPQQLKNASLKLTVNGTEAESSAREVVNGNNHITLTAPQLKEGSFTVVAELQTSDTKSHKVEQPWAIIPRSRAKVTINADGYPVYDGKAIFPMGIFNGGRFEEQAKAGFTVTHAYNAVRIPPGERPNDEMAKTFLDQTEKFGMKALFMVPMRLGEVGDWEGIRRRIRLFRNHPGLLAWDEEEGLARGDWKMETLAMVRKIIKEEDPNHPFMVGDARASIGQLVDRSNFFPAEHLDMGMWWWYPFPPKSTADDALAGEQKFTGELIVPEFLTKRNTDKPIWLGIQSYKKGDPARFPTPVEYRSQPYIAFLEGAKGVVWYGGSVTNGMFSIQDGKSNAEEANWKYVQQLVAEVKEMAPILMSPSAEKPTHMPEDVPMSVGIRKAKEGPVLIAVNRTFKPVDITFASNEIRAGHAKVATENREVTTSKGELKDHFEPLEVHVYFLPGK